ncbi:hypothetical protein D3C85_1404860 [compost metagenome]
MFGDAADHVQHGGDVAHVQLQSFYPQLRGLNILSQRLHGADRLTQFPGGAIHLPGGLGGSVGRLVGVRRHLAAGSTLLFHRCGYLIALLLL